MITNLDKLRERACLPVPVTNDMDFYSSSTLQCWLDRAAMLEELEELRKAIYQAGHVAGLLRKENERLENTIEKLEDELLWHKQ